MFVRVNRSPEIEKVRNTLPAVLTEQEVVDAVRTHAFSIVCGDTGCGKSTQVPQFLYEAGYTEGANSGYLIGVTQPRRVAAVAVSERVGIELNNPGLVGYQVRYEKKVSSKSMRIKFMTDGILLREIMEDIRLPRYSVIIIDEAHERSINCDMLLGLLSGSVRARRGSAVPLKVVIMSATLRMTDFTSNKSLLPSTVVQIDNRTHPVTVHYERRTEEDYVSGVIAKIRKIHSTLPPGSILVFLTGKAEVHAVCRGDGVDSGSPAGWDEEEEEEEEEEEDEERSNQWNSVSPRPSKRTRPDEVEADFNLGLENSCVEELENLGDKSSSGSWQFSGGGAGSRLRVMPLYAAMPSERQLRTFQAHIDHPGDRIVVVATNVAETSLTIPNVRYVVDCGREKRKEFNANGVSRFAIRFVSKASANQRAGRAGRVGPGHVYRLFSPNVFGEHMPDFPSAEIETNPLDSPILVLKAMGVPRFQDFPWPAPPPELHVTAALRRLSALGALDSAEKITPLGRLISQFPLSPRLAVPIVVGWEQNSSEVSSDEKLALLLLLCAMAAMLSVESILIPADPESMKSREIEAKNFHDDLEMALSKFALWLRSVDKPAFSQTAGLSEKSMQEAFHLFQQLCRTCVRNFKIPPITDPESIVSTFSPKNRKLSRLVRESFLHGFLDQVAFRDETGSKAYRAPGSTDLVFIHSSSVLYKRRPQWLAFSEMMQAELSGKRTMRIFMQIDPEHLASLNSPLIDKSKNHHFLKPSVVKGERVEWRVPRYSPLGTEIVSCVRVVGGRNSPHKE